MCYDLHYYSLYLLFFKILQTLTSLIKGPIKQSQYVGSSLIQVVQIQSYTIQLIGQLVSWQTCHALPSTHSSLGGGEELKLLEKSLLGVVQNFNFGVGGKFVCVWVVGGGRGGGHHLILK